MGDDAFEAEWSCDLLVSIVNYRTADLTIACIQSVLADFEHSPGWPANGQIVVVDNASGDGSADRIAEWISEANAPVTLIRSDTNTGFSGGHNQAINAGKAQHYLVLNSDAVLRTGFCEQILKAAAAHPQAGLIAPRLEYEDGTPQISCFRLPSPASELIRGAETGPITRLFKRYDVPLGTEPTAQNIGWASFACILLRGDMLDQIGHMDDGYFLYFEDTEFCMRAGRAGWKIAHTPQARAVHFRGGSAPVKELARARKRLPAYYYASRSRLFYQSYGYAGLWFANLLWHVGRGIARLRMVFGKPVPSGVEAEAWDIWINALTPMRVYDATGPRT